MILRDYQKEAVADLQASAKHHRRILFQLPTGGGKTVIMTDLVARAEAKAKRVLMLAPRRELIYQAAQTIGHTGRDCCLILAGEELIGGFQTYVASFDTLHARCVQRDRFPLPPADLVLVDEAHLSLAKTRRDIIDAYPDATIIGVTATPCRGDGRGLGQLYDDLVIGPSIKQLTDEGHLVPVRYFAGQAPDVSGVKLVAGDYHQKQLAEVVDQPGLVGDVVENWSRIAGDKRTVIFATSIKHSRHIEQELLRYGVAAEHIDGMTKNDEREAIMARVRSGETQVLVNVFVASYGLDIPELECAVLARPTKSLGLYFQTCGRVLRPAKGKHEAIVIDHAGCVAEHGFLDTPVPWSLAGNARVQQQREQEMRERNEPRDIECPKCRAIFRGRRDCPACGHELIPMGEDVPTHRVDLAEIARAEKRDKAKANREWVAEHKAEFFAELQRYALDKGYKKGWAAHKYREKFGVWPNAHGDVQPATAISPATRSYIRYINIKKAKERAAA